MLAPRGRRLRLLLLLIGLAALLAVIATQFRVSADLRAFMPKAETANERLLLDQIAEGPGSRLLFLTLSGADDARLAELSNDLRAELKTHDSVRLIANGAESIDDLPADLLAYRYLLSDRFDAEPINAGLLHEELLIRESELASPAAFLLEDWLARDPTLEVLRLAENLRPAQEPNRLHEVWFDAAGERALLLLEPEAGAFDALANRALLAEIEQTFARLRQGGPTRLEINGPGAYSVRMETRIRQEANRLGLWASIGMVLLLLLAYRSLRVLWLGALPLLLAGLAGVAAVALLFGTVHGITLAFGFTLIGVAQDYPMHLLSHLHRGETPIHSARRIWPTLLTGVASTSIAYLAFYWSGVDGLRQLAMFTVTGLLAAALCTRFILPDWLRPTRFDPARSPMLQLATRVFAQLARLRPLVLALAVLALAYGAWRPLVQWENNLAKLSPLPSEWLQREVELRQALGTPDMRHLLVLNANDSEAALGALEALQPALLALRAEGAIGDFDHAARLLPSLARQRQRQAALPDLEALPALLAQAVERTAFDAELFAPFAEELAAAKVASPLRPEDLKASALGLRIGGMLFDQGEGAQALITLSGIRDLSAVQAFAATHPGLQLIDLKAASEGLVARYRQHILSSLLLAAGMLVGVILLALRSLRRSLRVLLPMSLSTLFILLSLHLLGVPLSLFHLIALVLAAGLGIDYALFFEASQHDPQERQRSLHALLVCAGSTALVFALLAGASLPVLHALGLTVTLGVVYNFLLALILLPRHD